MNCSYDTHDVRIGDQLLLAIALGNLFFASLVSKLQLSSSAAQRLQARFASAQQFQ